MEVMLFDWDGVLLNSVDVNLRGYRKILKRLNFPSMTKRWFLESQTPNWYDFYIRLGIPRRLWTGVDKLWLKFYAQETPKLYLDVKPTLRLAREHGIKLGLVSNGIRDRVSNEVEGFDLKKFFDVMVLGGDADEMKPSPKPIELALRMLRSRPDESIYVGDCPEDVIASKAAGVKVAVITRGLSAKERLIAVNPDFIFPNLKALSRRLLTSPLKPRRLNLSF